MYECDVCRVRVGGRGAREITEDAASSARKLGYIVLADA